MKTLSIYSIRMVVVMITALTLALPNKAQVSNNSDVYLGKIQVYLFSMDSLYYQRVKRLSAVGRELSADLYSSKVGDDTYFRITIEGDSYAVVSNPYGSRVSSEYYYDAWILKKGQYVKKPDLAYMAGPYFLTLPYAKTDDRRNTNMTNNVSSSSTPVSSTTRQIEWQLMGKVRVVSDMRITGYNEQEVIYEEETAFLYSAFDGEKTKYKITIPKYGSQYDVYKNGSYNGEKVQWDSHGKRIRHLPSLSQMFTHYAGNYYLNIDAVVH